MSQGIITDNWSLQDINSLFTTGLSPENSREIVFKNGKHDYKPVLHGVIQTEALFDFITDLILRDEILVDEEFSSAWLNQNGPIHKAKDLDIVRTYAFLAKPELLDGPRARIVERLCSTESLLLAQKANEEVWNTSGATLDDLLSATLWGGAGMCARSFVYEKGYTPHPLRKRLFVNSGFMLPADDALNQIKDFLNDKRLAVSQKLFGQDELYSAYVNIPALPIRVIQDSNSADELIFTALQMRDDFLQLREWLKTFQNAMSKNDTASMLKHRKELDSVGDYVDRKIGKGSKASPITMSAGIGIFKISYQGHPLEDLRNQFGVRATLNKLIFGGTGKPEIRKFVRMFDEGNSDIGFEVERAFTSSL